MTDASLDPMDRLLANRTVFLPFDGGTERLPAPASVACRVSGSAMAWATFAVIVARSTRRGGRAVASPGIQRTRSPPGLARAAPREARAGSTPTTSIPRPARRSANTPVPQPMSRTWRAPNSSAIRR